MNLKCTPQVCICTWQKYSKTVAAAMVRVSAVAFNPGQSLFYSFLQSNQGLPDYTWKLFPAFTPVEIKTFLHDSGCQNELHFIHLKFKM